MVSVVLVDDHELVRVGFRMILERECDIEIGGEAGTAEEGLELIRHRKPDVALIDVHMPGMSGLELTERILRAGLPTRVVILTVVSDTRFPRHMLDAGACGYLTKSCRPEELVTAVRKAAVGQRYLAPALAQRLAFATFDDESPFDVLSTRELEVAMMLVRGQSLGVIGEQLQLSPKTVSTYKQRLMDKLGVSHVVELANLMTAHGLLDNRMHASVVD